MNSEKCDNNQLVMIARMSKGNYRYIVDLIADHLDCHGNLDKIFAYILADKALAQACFDSTYTVLDMVKQYPQQQDRIMHYLTTNTELACACLERSRNKAYRLRRRYASRSYKKNFQQFEHYLQQQLAS